MAARKIAKKPKRAKTRKEIIEYAASLVDELDGLIWDIEYYERELKRSGDPVVATRMGATRPTSKIVQKIQKKSNELWRTLESYRNRVVKERP